MVAPATGRGAILRDFVDTFLAMLRSRYAECSLIELALIAGDDIDELVGAFQARRDGIIRRHVYRIEKREAGEDVAARTGLRQALERFSGEIDRITRLSRE
jgi:hypothetical protein